jgi:type II secretory pathway component HofQ
MKKRISFYVMSFVLAVFFAGAVPSISFAQEETPAAVSSRLDVLDLKNMDVNDVMKLISQKSGLNIVASSNVKGKVTIYLKDVDVLEALGIIVEANEWAYVKEGGIIKVMAAADYETKYGGKFAGRILE